MAMFKKLDVEEEKDIFDEIEDIVEEKMSQMFAFKAKEAQAVLKKVEPKAVNPSIKKFEPEKVTKIALSNEIMQFIMGEMKKMKPPEKVIEKVVIKEVDQGEMSKTREKMTNLISSMKDEIVKKFQAEIARLNDEKNDLEQEVQRLKSNEGQVTIVRSGIPNPSGKGGQFVSSDGSSFRWYPIYGDVSDPTIPIGLQSENGSWRIVISGNDLSFQRLESGTWTEKGAFLA